MNPYKGYITFWAQSGTDGYGGKVFSPPELLRGRWEDRQEQFVNAMQETSLSKAVIFFPQAYKEKLEIGGYLLNDISTATDPTQVTGSFEIQALLIMPDLRMVKNELRAIL